jgi:protein-tyrosine phosphatase
MIDIHTHILPGIDDGPVNSDQSLKMLHRGVAEGILGLVCTSHVLDQLDEKVEARFIKAFKELEKKVKENHIPINLWLGSEIHCHAAFNRNSKLATLNGNGKYILFELPMIEVPKDAKELFFDLSLDGLTPILAHPERNLYLQQNLELVEDFVQRGVLMQINAGSLTGDFGRKVKQTAFKMMQQKIVHFVASDCHSVKTRPLAMKKAYKMVSRKWGEPVGKRLFRINPYKAVIGEQIVL